MLLGNEFVVRVFTVGRVGPLVATELGEAVLVVVPGVALVTS